MARSLVVKHTETPGTSSLFTTFLLIAVGWLMLSALAAALTAAPAEAAPVIDVQ